MLKNFYHKVLTLINQNPFDGLIFVYLFFIPIIDTLNGILLHSNLPSIAQPYKTLFIGLVLLRIFTLNKLVGVFNLLFCFPFFLGDSLNLIFNQDTSYFGKDFGHSLKQLMFVVSISYFILFSLSHDTRSSLQLM